MRHLKHSLRTTAVGIMLILAMSASVWDAPGIRPLSATAAGRPSAIGTSGSQSVAAVMSPAGLCRAEGWTPVHRKSVVSRGKKWVKAKVPYDQSKCHKTGATRKPGDQYRTDCSGFVSMAWALDGSYTTADFARDRTGGWHTVKWEHLEPGDAIVAHTKGLSHIVLFVKWEDADHTELKAYEEKGEEWGTVATVRNVADMRSAGYHPIQHDQIEQ